MRSGTSTKALRALLAALALGTALEYPRATARAQEAPQGREPGSLDPCADLRGAAVGDPTLLTRDGVPGMWFPMPVARLILCEARELRVRRQEVRLLDEAAGVWALRVRLLEEQADLAVQARNELGDVVEAAERRAREAAESADAWYRHPALWFAVGVVVAGLLVAGAVAVIGAI